MNHNLTTSKILKTSGIYVSQPDETLGGIINQFHSSHDAVVVVENNKVLGVVSPYYALIQRQFPLDTKLKHALIHPPHITHDTHITECIRLILESKLHNIPVVEDKKLIGMITARRILERLQIEQAMGKDIEVIIGSGYVHTITLGSSMSEVHTFFRRTKLSKIVVVDIHNHVKGIISMYDVAMKKTQKKRVEDVMQRHVICVQPPISIRDVIGKMLHEEVGSVIIVNKARNPKAIITTSDVLRYQIQ